MSGVFHGAPTGQLWRPHAKTKIRAHACTPKRQFSFHRFEFVFQSSPVLLVLLGVRDSLTQGGMTCELIDFWGRLRPRGDRSNQNTTSCSEDLSHQQPNARNVLWQKTFPREAITKTVEKRWNSTCSASEKRTMNSLFTVVSADMCWQSLKLLDYVMLTEQANGVRVVQGRQKKKKKRKRSSLL